MYQFSELIKTFENEIKALNLEKEPILLYEPIRYLLEAGGKRVRPILTLMSHNLFSDNIDDSMNAAIAVELFHNFTLLHDDIMDNASIRRGRMTANKKWNDNIAILSGDTMTIMAYQYLLKTPTKTQTRVMEVFSKFAIEICEGQRYDMDFENISDVSMEQYIEMIRLKTSVLLAGAMEIGAVIGGADEKSIHNLYKFGECLGLAFQLSDDYLDTYGDSKTFGKAIGGDIAEGKKTFLYITTLMNAPENKRQEIMKLFSSNDLSKQEKFEKVKDCYDNYKANQILKDQIQKYYTQAIEYLDKVEVVAERKNELRQLAKLLIERDK